MEYLEGYRNIFGVRVTGLYDNSSLVKTQYLAPNSIAPYPLDYVIGRDGRVELWETEYDIREVVGRIEKLLAEENVVDVAVTPGTTGVYPGGQLPYTVSVTNNTAQIQSFQAWGEEIRPDSTRVQLWGPFPVQLSAGQTLSVNLSESISLSATPGSHSLKVKIGQSHPDAFDVDDFDFVVY
jgi:hypothetical protein